MLTLIGVLSACVYFEDPLLLAAIPASMFAGIMIFFRALPETMYHQSRVHPVIPMRTMSLLRTTYISLIINGLAWLSFVQPYAALFYVLLWLVPIFTSFSFFMILRQIVQHDNDVRGCL